MDNYVSGIVDVHVEDDVDNDDSEDNVFGHPF